MKIVRKHNDPKRLIINIPVTRWNERLFSSYGIKGTFGGHEVRFCGEVVNQLWPGLIKVKNGLVLTIRKRDLVGDDYIPIEITTNVQWFYTWTTPRLDGSDLFFGFAEEAIAKALSRLTHKSVKNLPKVVTVYVRLHTADQQ